MIIFSKLTYILKVTLISMVFMVGISVLTAKASQPSNAIYWQDAINSVELSKK